MTYDVCIIGGGAAGLTAGIFAARRGLTTIILTKDFGGQTASTAEIENYPGFGRVEGLDLMKTFLDNALSFGCAIVYEEALSIQAVDGMYACATAARTIECLSVILAFGKTPKSLGVSNEDVFFGKGLYYSAHDPEQFRDKTVVIVGGGNSAVQTAVRLSTFAKKMYVVHRRDVFRAEKVLLSRLDSIFHIEQILNAHVTELYGSDKLEGVRIEISDKAETKEWAVDAVIVHIGLESKTALVEGLVDLAIDKRIHINAVCETSREGIFAAGDATTVPYQQIVISAGEGAKAAISAYTYVQKKKGLRALKVDWGFVG
ncbi:FAD-dependent oxidoreductase [Candidatus Uhrbacteria bacterium]|nr:FAD-dependent oxidoreductase [Candidatus Uhrbacteria bacterium]